MALARKIGIDAAFHMEFFTLFATQTPNASVLWAGIACSPCVNAYNNRQSVCRNNLCMQAITVEQVFAKVILIYEASSLADVSAFAGATAVAGR